MIKPPTADKIARDLIRDAEQLRDDMPPPTPEERMAIRRIAEALAPQLADICQTIASIVQRISDR